LDTARDLGVILDSHLTMAAEMIAYSAWIFSVVAAALCYPICLYYLIQKVDPVIVLYCLDFFNLLLIGFSDGFGRRLQSSQNTAACLSLGRDRIAPACTLSSLATSAATDVTQSAYCIMSKVWNIKSAMSSALAGPEMWLLAFDRPFFDAWLFEFALVTVSEVVRLIRLL
jgi:hypothetical protein